MEDFSYSRFKKTNKYNIDFKINNIKNYLISTSYREYINQIKPYCLKNNNMININYKEKIDSYFLPDISNYSCLKLPEIDVNKHLNSYKVNFYEYLNLTQKDLKKEETYNTKELLKKALLKMKDNYDLSESSRISIYNENSQNKVTLKINSFTIIFNRINKENQVYKIKLPLEFIILFHTCTYEETINIISKSIKLQNQNITLSIKWIDIIKIVEKNIDNFEIIDKNKIEFIWFDDTDIYQVTLISPNISFKAFSRDFTIKINIPTDLFIFIYSINYLDWEEYILNFLISNKKFRLNFNSILSRYHILRRKKIFLDKKITNYTNSEDNESIYAIYSNYKFENYFLKCYGYNIESRKSFNKQIIYINWYTTIKMLSLRSELNLEQIINRRISINENNISLNENWIEFINIEKEYNFVYIPKNYKKKVNLINPKIIWESYKNEKISRGEIIIPNEHLNELIGIDTIKEYYVYLSNNLKDLLSSKEKNIQIKISSINNGKHLSPVNPLRKIDTCLPSKIFKTEDLEDI